MSTTPTRTQTSSGGVAYREIDGVIQVALISVGEQGRWQLPKGNVDKGETPSDTALREVREEAGVETELVEPLDTIEYWFYVPTKKGGRLRIHKFVHFFLLRYLAGSTESHDHEVNEARWFAIDEAISTLTFENEREIVQKAKERILSGGI